MAGLSRAFFAGSVLESSMFFRIAVAFCFSWCKTTWGPFLEAADVLALVISREDCVDFAGVSSGPLDFPPADLKLSTGTVAPPLERRTKEGVRGAPHLIAGLGETLSLIHI